MERELDLFLKIVVPPHGLFFRPIGIHDDFLGDAILPVVISSRFGHFPIPEEARGHGRTGAVPPRPLRVFQPVFLLFKIFVGFWFKVNVLRRQISCSFQVIEIVVDLLGCKQPPDFTDEGRYFGSEQGVALGRVQEGEEFLADQIVQRVLQAEPLADTFGCRALVDPDFVDLYWGAVHAWVLLSRIRRTEVRPMLSRREISDLLRPAKCSLRIWLAWSPAVKGRPRRLPFCRGWARPARTRAPRISRSKAAKTASSAAIARPAGVVRSSASVSDTKPTPRCSSSCSVVSKSVTDLPPRSSRHTSTTSISRRRAASSNLSRSWRP